MGREMYAPISAQSHSRVGMLVMLETHRRVFKGQFGALPRPLSDDAFSMGGYCLDAFDELPAGSMQYSRFGSDEDDWLWEPTMINREEVVGQSAKEKQ